MGRVFAGTGTVYWGDTHGFTCAIAYLQCHAQALFYLSIKCSGFPFGQLQSFLIIFNIVCISLRTDLCLTIALIYF